MKQKLLIIMLVISIMLGCASCEAAQPILPDPEFSDKYLVGIDVGGASWGLIYDCIDARVIVCTDGDVLMFMPTDSHERSYEQTLKQIAAFKLTEEQYTAINEKLDRKKLYHMQINSESDVLDGYSEHLLLYDKDEKILKRCGAYMPTTESFREMVRTVIDNIPLEEILEVRDRYVDELREKEEAEWKTPEEREGDSETDKEGTEPADTVFESFKQGKVGAKYAGTADRTTVLYTKEVLEEGGVYTWEQISKALGSVEYGPGSSASFTQTDDESYREIDCGNDGVRELCVEGVFNDEYGLHMIIKYLDGELRIVYIGDSWNRSDLTIEDNGVITGSGSAGATVHVTDYACVDENGDYHFCYGVTQWLTLYDNMYVHTEGDELTTLPLSGIDMFHLGLNEYWTEDEMNNRTYYYEYFVLDDDYNDITTEADYSDSFELRKRFADLGIKTYTSEEIKKLIEAKKEEIQFPG